MSRRAGSASVLITLMLAAPLLGCNPFSGGRVVRTSDDAGDFVGTVIRGGDPEDFTVADNASPIAKAAVRDAGAVKDFRALVSENKDEVCEVVGVIEKWGDIAPDSTANVQLDGRQQASIRLEAGVKYRIHVDRTQKTIDSSQRMAQSTFVKAADAACDVSDIGI